MGENTLSKDINIMVLNPPSPPYLDVFRDYAGGFGTALPARKRASYGHSRDALFYPSLPYISAVLQAEGYDYSILDAQRLKLNMSELLNVVEKRDPDVVISLLGLPSLKGDLELLDAVKKSLSNVTLVGIGTSCRVLQKEIFRNSQIDILSSSVYPYVSNLTLLLEALESKRELKNVPAVSFFRNGKVIRTLEIQDPPLDSLLPPIYDGLELFGYEHFYDVDGNSYSYVSILGSKGCPYQCYYCPYPPSFGSRLSKRSPEDIMNEIEYLSSRGVRGFMLRAESFAMDKKHAMTICRKMIDRKLDEAWMCQLRVNHVDKEILQTMRKAGCKCIQFGVETGDEKLIKKGKPLANLDMVRKTFRLTKEMRIYSMAHIIFGWPEETQMSLERTAELVSEIAPDKIDSNFLTPYPGTELRRVATENKLILTNDWSEYTSHNIVMRTKYLDAGQLQKTAAKVMHDYHRKRLIRLLFSVTTRPRYAIGELGSTLKSYAI